jgi:MSHA biogenesis protein MshP
MKTRSRNRGFTMITVLFILVVVAGLMAYQASISGTQHLTKLFSVNGSRALFAAESGIEWAVNDALENSAAELNCGSTAVTLTPAGGTTNGFSINISCTSVAGITEGSDPPYTIYQLTSTASRGTLGSPDYVQRSMRATVCAGCP